MPLFFYRDQLEKFSQQFLTQTESDIDIHSFYAGVFFLFQFEKQLAASHITPNNMIKFREELAQWLSEKEDDDDDDDQ